MGVSLQIEPQIHRAEIHVIHSGDHEVLNPRILFSFHQRAYSMRSRRPYSAVVNSAHAVSDKTRGSPSTLTAPSPTSRT